METDQMVVPPKVTIYCGDKQTVAHFERGVWRCARCGKHVRVLTEPTEDPVKGEAA